MRLWTRGRAYLALLLVCGLAGLAVVTGLVADSSRTAPLPFGRSPLPVPGTGAYFGTEFSSSVDRAHLIAEQEGELGRTFDIDHVYHPFDATFPDAYDQQTVAQGHILFISWTCRLGGPGTVDWRDIAAGRWDTVIDARARALQAFGRPVLVSFCHEPGAFEGSDRSGSPGDYVDAWRHIAERFQRLGVTNVAWVWTTTAYSFRRGSAAQYYPGDDVISWVGADGYVNIGCPWLNVGWSSWTDVFGAANSFAREHDKPLIVAEFGLREDPRQPDRKRRWLESSLPEMRAMSQLHAVVAFNSVESCSSYVASSAQALDGYRVLARSAFFDGTPKRRAPQD